MRRPARERVLASALAIAVCASSCGGRSHTSSGGADGYSDITDSANWSTFDLTAVDPTLTNFQGGVFDGRFVYVFATGGHAVLRFDTQGAFTDPSAWVSFQPTSFGMTSAESAGFDGRYLYFSGGSGVAPYLVRFDTTAPFTSDASWTPFTTAALPGFFDGAGLGDGAGGDAFDGRYMYFAAGPAGPLSTTIARYDTQGPFDSATSWTTFDVATAAASAHAVLGPTTAGRNVYVFDADSSTLTPIGAVQQYDTQASFASSASWGSFNTSTVLAAMANLLASTFDGRFAYFFSEGGVARFDTLGSFSSATDWSVGPTLGIFSSVDGPTDPEGSFAFFDGRYVSFFGAAGSIARFDTTGAFGDSASWTQTTVLDASGADGGTANAMGQLTTAAFDGKYLYIFGQGSIVERFEAKSTSALPPDAPAALF